MLSWEEGGVNLIIAKYSNKSGAGVLAFIEGVHFKIFDFEIVMAPKKGPGTSKTQKYWLTGEVKRPHHYLEIKFFKKLRAGPPYIRLITDKKIGWKMAKNYFVKYVNIIFSY